MNSTPEKKHKKLVQIINENNHILNLSAKERPITGSENWENLDTNEINDVVSLIVSYLHLTGGSIGAFNLYELLQSYFLDKEARFEINDCVSRSLTKKR